MGGESIKPIRKRIHVYFLMTTYAAAEEGREAPIYLIDCYAQENYQRVRFIKNYK